MLVFCQLVDGQKDMFKLVLAAINPAAAAALAASDAKTPTALTSNPGLGIQATD